MSALASKNGCPVIVAGDLFAAPDVSLWLLCLCLDHLPFDLYVVTGSSGIGWQSLDGLDVLVKAGRATVLDGPLHTSSLAMHGFPRCRKKTICPERHPLDTRLHVAICVEGHSFVRRYCGGYDTVVSGLTGKMGVLCHDGHVEDISDGQ